MRIVSLISAGTEMLFALGLGENVVAVSHECDWPPECKSLPRASQSNVDSSSASGAIDLQARSLLAAGKLLYEIDQELLSELQPDLIVTQAQCDVCAVPYAHVLQAVERNSRLRTTQVFSLNPNSLEDVFADMLRLGIAADVRDRAEQVVAGLRQRVERIRHATEAISSTDRPRTAVIEWTDPLMLAGNWVPELIEMAGGQCELTPPDQHSRVFEWGELAQFDPEVIVVCPCGFDLKRAQQEAKLLEGHRAWHDLSAVHEARVFAIDGNAYLNRPGPRLVDSVELLASLLHPGRFKAINYATAPSEGPSPK
jgi:iron complex transport system substrate-binding protein